METVARVAILYVFVLSGLRLLGKREFSQFSPIELIGLMMIPEIISPALRNPEQETSVLEAAIGVVTLFALVYGISYFSYRNSRFEDFVSGKCTPLLKDGILIKENMKRERLSMEELKTEVRKAGLERFDQVKLAMLESDGKISIVPRDPAARNSNYHMQDTSAV